MLGVEYKELEPKGKKRSAVATQRNFLTGAGPEEEEEEEEDGPIFSNYVMR